jgi:hypothetical protein
MKKVLLTLLAVIVIVGAMGASGMVGYRYGYSQGASSATDGETPALVPGFGNGPQRMPMHPFEFERDFGPGRGFDRGFEMMPGGMMRFGFFGPLMFLARIAFWALVIWAVYMLVTRSGWRLTRTTQPVESQPASAETDSKQ